ncbi:ribosome biogenesis GTPase Der [Schlesneria paludicola]|uniref:ribosome biogenesis GTPase Der n=1 Tax=Schlesneria paludicola TaxID=360056 RepID=UPI00029A22C7|nr:ribosome biogenesis GTPase Der [Schlesneria paludicola]
MSVPKVAIVGRPNVGKSSIMNWLAHKRVSVVDPMAGVTRDRVTYLMHVEDRYFELIDTGGIGIVDVGELTDEVDTQIRIAIEQADVIMFVVEGPAGITALDQEVSRRLWKIEKPKLLVVNKCDSPKVDQEVAEFYQVADAPMVTISVKGNRNQDLLLHSILKVLPDADDSEAEEGEQLEEVPELKLAIVGRRNVGKSTFINQLADDDRVIVSEIPGTTRDSIDVRFQMDEKAFIAIDTPGVRKRKSLANNVEWYGLARAKRSIRRANVVLMFFDCLETVSKVDKQLVGEIHSEHKPCIFVVNKWDLAPEATATTDWAEYLFKNFSHMRHVPVCVITAKEGRNIKKLINLAQSIYKQSRFRAKTGELNKLVRAAVKNAPPPVRMNRTPRILYATQVSTEPPTIVIKCNAAELFDEDYKRYLLGVLRERLPFKEVPIKLYFRSKSDDQRGEREELISSALDKGIDMDEFEDEIMGTDLDDE